MQAHDSKKQLRVDIQALRALAVVAVVVCHMNPAWLPGGYLGVDVFFVISGFVITQLLQEKQANISFGHFWLQRVFRIYPAYIMMLTVVTSLAAVVFLPGNFSQFSKSWQESLVFTSNQYFAGYGDYFSPALTEQPLLHTWSLAIEMQFYLLYPLFLLLVLRLRAPWMLLATSVAGFIYAEWRWIEASPSTELYYALFLRAPEFLLGCALATYTGKLNPLRFQRFGLRMAMIGFLILLLSLSLINEHRFSPVMAALACVGAGFVILGRVEQGLLAALYKQKLVLQIGALSYSIYLWHWPILAFIRYVYSDIQWTLFSILFYAFLVYFIGWASWNFVEKKCGLKSLQDKFLIAKKLMLMVFLAVSPVLYAKQINELVPPLPTELTRYADDKTICHGKTLSNCVRGDASSSQILLIGDSHAAQLNLAADVAGKRLGLGIEVITASSCIPVPGFNFKKLPEWAQDSCQTQIDIVSQKLVNERRVVLAGMWSYQFQDESFPQVLEDFLEKTEARGQQIWVLAQIPKFTKNPTRLNRLHYWGIDVSPEPAGDWAIANNKLAQILKKHPTVQFFEPSQSQLFATPPFYKKVLIYSDEHHLNEIGAKNYGILLADLFKTTVH